MEQCEFCGRNVKKTEGTSFVGMYCIHCHRLNRAESLDAIKRMQGKQIAKSKKVIREEVKEQEMKKALNGLIGDNNKSFDTSVFIEDR